MPLSLIMMSIKDINLFKYFLGNFLLIGKTDYFRGWVPAVIAVFVGFGAYCFGSVTWVECFCVQFKDINNRSWVILC